VTAPTLAASEYLEMNSLNGIQAFDLSAIKPFPKAFAYLDARSRWRGPDTDYLIVAVALGVDGKYHAAATGSSLTSLSDHANLTEVYDISECTTGSSAIEGIESATL
jgi:hypothetical protein